MGMVQIPAPKRKNNFHSGRNTNTWKAFNSEAKALGRKAGLQMTKNHKRPKDNFMEGM